MLTAMLVFPFYYIFETLIAMVGYIPNGKMGN